MPRIVIIDDEEPIRRLLRLALERAGYEVATASEGNAGLRSCRESKTDLVITDLVMPEKEGIETIQELRRVYPDIKIIAISGGGQISPVSYLSIAERIGANRTFEKPIDTKALVTAVGELLNEPD
jgi:DNA-binding NtrC family response regulator